MPSISSKLVATALWILGVLGTSALLACVVRRLDGELCTTSNTVCRATAASHTTRLLQTRRDLREKANTEADFVPQVVSGVLQKTVVSSKMRVLFLVGLEGTGHHTS